MHAFVASDDAASVVASDTSAVTATISAGEGVVVAVLMHNSGGDVTGVADAMGNTYTSVGAPLAPAGEEVYALYYCKNVIGGTGAIAATFDSEANYSGIAYFRFTGLSTSGDAQGMSGSTQTASGTDTDALTSGNVTPSDQPAMVFGLTVDGDGGSTIAAGTGFTDRGSLANWNSVIGFNTAFEHKRITSLSAVAATFTSNQGAHRMNTVGAVFTEAVAAGAPPQRPRQNMGALLQL